MYYELINEQWKPNRSKSVLFNGSTYPIGKVPDEFWNADRMPAVDTPVYNPETHKLVGPQVIGETVGYVKETLTVEEIAQEFENKKQEFISNIQQHLDITAQTHGYDSVDSATKYIGGKNELWSAEGTALLDCTIDTWAKGFTILTDITTGYRPEPTIEELIAELPEMIWPTA